MGRGTAIVSHYHIKKGYYCEKDWDKNFGGDFWFLIEPLNGNCDNKFFIVRKLDNGKYEIEGEVYIITNPDSLTEHKKEIAATLKKFPTIYYYFLDEMGQIVKVESFNRLTKEVKEEDKNLF